VRTLHHYDELGLLCPSERSEGGYRLYCYDDLARLREILIWRRLGVLAQRDPVVARRSGPRPARRARAPAGSWVQAEIERLGALIGAVEAAIDAELSDTRLEGDDDVRGIRSGRNTRTRRASAGADTGAYRESACSPQMHRALGDMYVADERFASELSA